MIRSRILPALVPALLLLAACSDTDQPAGETTTTVAADELEGTVTVLAAASLTGAFAEIAEAFEADHKGVDVELTFDGSAKLATVILEGAPADVFASADAANMAKVAADDLLTGAASIFATNILQIVVPAGNPLGISSLDDLIDPDVTLSLCREAVPCGKYAAQALDKAGLDVPPTGVQDSVKGVLTQVQLGEADAGIVYVTDVLAADDVEGIDLAPDQQIEATYPAAAIADGPNPKGAAAFLVFLTGDTAQSILEDYGFGLHRAAVGSDQVVRTNASNDLLSVLASLTVEREHPRDGYARSLFPHWDDDDTDRCDTRCEVLAAQRRTDGSWLSEWDGYTTDDPRELQVDHVVALAEAWDSGADRWSAADRDEFADYMPNLLAVSAASNVRKSDKDAAGWFPSRADANCLWASTVVHVKDQWKLAVDRAEADALGNLLRTCSDYVPPTTATG